MTNKDIKNALREEIEKQVPDVLDNILLNCEEKESVKMKKKQEKVKNIKFIFSVIFGNILCVLNYTIRKITLGL